MLNLLAQTYETYEYSYPTTTTDTAAAGIAVGMLLLIFLFVAIFLVVMIIGMWKTFEKAGEPGWKAIIPVYNTWTLMEISGKPGWWALITLIPYLGGLAFLVLDIIAMLQLAKNFGKSDAFAIVALILFPYVGFLMLGFGEAKYRGGKYVAPNSAAPAA